MEPSAHPCLADDTSIVDLASRTVRTTMKSFTIANGTLIVVGDWTVTFDASLKASCIHQKMLFSPNVGLGSPVQPTTYITQATNDKASTLTIAAMLTALLAVSLVLAVMVRTTVSAKPMISDYGSGRMITSEHTRQL